MSISAIKKALKGLNINYIENDILTIVCAKQDLKKIIQNLKTNKNLNFTILIDLFGVDMLHAKQTAPKRFEVVYSLLSLELNKRIIVKVLLDDHESLDTISDILSAANWYEREVFDMFGVNFIGHPKLERILTDYGFVGHPLRKDFPLSGHLQVKYDASLEKVIYEPVSLEQNFREFDFTSNWHGPNNMKKEII